MLSMLEEVLRQNPVTGRRRIARQLLVFFEYGLGIAARLDPFGPVGLKGPVGVLLLGLAQVSAIAAIAATLAFHSFKVSHSSPFRPCRPGADSAGLILSP